MIENEILNKIFEDRLEKIEENIQKEYHDRVKKLENNEEKENKKMNIIGELYYKQGFKDGINFILNNMRK